MNPNPMTLTTPSYNHASASTSSASGASNDARSKLINASLPTCNWSAIKALADTLWTDAVKKAYEDSKG